LDNYDDDEDRDDENELEPEDLYGDE